MSCITGTRAPGRIAGLGLAACLLAMEGCASQTSDRESWVFANATLPGPWPLCDRSPHPQTLGHPDQVRAQIPSGGEAEQQLQRCADMLRAPDTMCYSFGEADSPSIRKSIAACMAAVGYEVLDDKITIVWFSRH